MIKIFLFLITLSLAILKGYSQLNNFKKDSLLKTWLKDQCYCDVLAPSCKQNKKFFYTDRQFLTNYSMNRLIREDLTKITLDEEGLPTLGNYATTQLSDDKKKITINVSFYNPFGKKEDWDPIKSILSVNVQAATKDNISTLFSNKNFNNEVGIKAKWSFLSRNTNYSNDDQMVCNDLKFRREDLLTEYKNVHTIFWVDSLSYEQTGQSIKERLDSAKKAHNYFDTTGAKLEQMDFLLKHFIETQVILNKAQVEADRFESGHLRYDSAKIIDSFYNRLITLETKDRKWPKMNIQWIDVDGNFAGEKYLLINKTRTDDAQLNDTSFSRWSVGVSVNKFNVGPSRFLKYGFFWKLGYSFGNDNSLTDEDAKDVTTTVTILDSAGARRQVSEKKSGYDKPFATSVAHLISFRASKYLNETKSQAFSFTTSFKLKAAELKELFKIQGKPVFTPGVAYLYAFQNREKEKNVVNIELYLNFNDILNSAKSDNKFYERHELGFKIGLPFNSIFLN